MRDPRTLLDRLDGSDLVVGVHDADEDRARRDRAPKVVRVDPAAAVDGQERDPCAQALEKPARFDDRRMLDPGRDDVLPFWPEREKRALEGEVVRLAAAAGENHLVAPAAEQRRHLAARRLDGALRLDRGPMPARRVAKMVRKKRTHGGGDRRIDRRARVVIEIDARRAHGSASR